MRKSHTKVKPPAEKKGPGVFSDESLFFIKRYTERPFEHKGCFQSIDQS